MFFHHSAIYLLLAKGMALYLLRLWPFGGTCSGVLERKIIHVDRLYILILSLEKDVAFEKKTLPRDALSKGRLKLFNAYEFLHVALILLSLEKGFIGPSFKQT